MSASHLLRSAVRLLPGLGILATLAHLARGPRGLAALGWLEAALMVLLLAGLAQATVRRVRRGGQGLSHPLRDDVELGGVLLAATFLVVSVGGPALFPLVYLVVACLVAYLSRGAGLALLGVAMALDAPVTLGGPGGLPRYLLHAFFLVLFGALYHLVLAARLAAARRAEAGAVAKRIREVEERARTFRLVSAGTHDSATGDKDEQQKWLLASISFVEGSLRAKLEMAETAMRTHTCAVFMLTSDDRQLSLHDSLSQSERLQRGRFSAGEGVLGGVIKRRMPVRMASRDGLRGLSYYDGGSSDVHSLVAVPIIDESDHLRGALVADRVLYEPFTEQDERLMELLAEDVLRAMEGEKVLNDVRKKRDETDRFYRAIEELNRAAEPDKVFAAVLEATRQLGDVDFAAVTLKEELEGKPVHRVARVLGATSQGLEGLVFEDNTGLVSNVVRYGAVLPGRDVKAMDRHFIFDEETRVRGLAALKIFPLRAGDQIVGTLVAGSRKKSALDHEAVNMVTILALQAAQAVVRAQLYQRMETMATTDGLTGLFNHRTFQARADELLAQARRYSRKCSLILTDIDHFKSVNDTYGHPTGDAVLRGVAKLIKAQARDTDVVARYGGEEFAIIMPETDAKGAQVIAERIREAVRAEVFKTEMGPLKVTLSLGIATLPDHHQEKQGLVDLADQCLYFAKRHGRNQSVTVQQMQAGPKRAAAAG